MQIRAQEAFQLLQPFSTADIFARSLSEVAIGAIRLEAGFYGSEGYRALHAMNRSGFPIDRLGAKSRVRWFGPFARDYVSDPSAGVPFLTSSTMLNAKIEHEKFISKALTRDLDRLMVNSGTILVSCSGTIGNVVSCTEEYDGCAVSQDAIRIDAHQPEDRGLIYFFAISDLGQFLLTRSKSGSVIEHLYESDIVDLPLPVFPRRLRRYLFDALASISSARSEANKQLRYAQRQLEELTAGLGVHIPYGAGVSALTTFVRASSCIAQSKEEGAFSRIDATYYSPDPWTLRNTLLENGGTRLRDNVSQVILIGKTFVEGVHKVDRDFGVPYFTGKELFSVRPIPETFITSARRALIDRLLVSNGTTLVTCAGTIGKAMYVSKALARSAVTHDAIRIIPGQQLHPGALYAILDSKLGRIQLKQCEYGSVIPRLYRSHVENLVIPHLPRNGEDIGAFVEAAFALRDAALDEECKAAKLFLDCIVRGRAKTEEAWGREY